MPRAGLSTRRLVEIASTVVDREGVSSLTLAKVAREAGVRAPSLYNHIGGLDDLVSKVTVQTIEDLAAVCREAVMGRAGAPALESLAHAYRAFALRRPGTNQLTQVARPGDADWVRASELVLEPLLAVFEGMGVEGDEAIHAIRALRSTLHGFVLLELNGGFGLDVAVDASFARLVSSITSGARP